MKPDFSLNVKGSTMNKEAKPDIQLTSNVVIVNERQEVLLTRYEADDERWWIPGASLESYEHPDSAAARALVDVRQDEKLTATMKHVESFRGRRGWHVMFNYLVRASTSESNANGNDTKWFPVSALPTMMHGEWEKNVIARCTLE
jgi:ADP-ribose pyrophosphatase YjhB (NUDIX family)